MNISLRDLYEEVRVQHDYNDDPPYVPSTFALPLPLPENVMTWDEQAEFFAGYEAWLDTINAQPVEQAVAA